ncbi:hypothetical protein M0Q97_12855 [Candidatus Dojkabacteria bacterium]|jgi:hypothetical protein|nr:hypothetical protein [Candidatus Dojkabacteria bacterium]
MKYLKTFENKSIDEEIELLNDLLNENPLHTDNDFYIFIGKDDFKENKDGSYRKTLEIERMIKIEADQSSIGAMKGLALRCKFQIDSTLYHIWLPKEFENEIANNGSNQIDDRLVDLINKYKNTGSDTQGKQILNIVKDRRNKIKKYNL